MGNYILNDKNELIKLSFSENGTLVTTKELSGVKEFATDTGGYSSLVAVMTDGRLLINHRSVSLDGVTFREEVVATDALALVSYLGVGTGSSTDGILYINTKNELCLWTKSGTSVLDTNVSCGFTESSYPYSYYIKTDKTLWQLKFNKTVPTIEFLLDDVTWATSWHLGGELLPTTLALRSDNSLWGWGNTSRGELGVSKYNTGSAASNSAGITFVRTGLHCSVDAPVKILDGVDRVFRDISSSSGIISCNVHAVMQNGSVISWGGPLIERDANAWQHTTRADKQWMANAAQIVNYRYFSVPYEIVQYNDGRLVFKEIGGYSNDGMGWPFNSVDRTATLDMKLLGETKATTPTPDLPSSWASDAVNAAINAGLVPDSLQGKYTQATTRAEFCALAVALYQNATNSDLPITTSFSDTTDENVLKMASLNVVNGVGDNKFAPDQKLTREQAATMLSRLAAALGFPLPGQTATFADSAALAAWSVDAVGQMQSTGIMTGVGDNTFSPQSDYTWEQSILTMLRLFDLVA